MIFVGERIRVGSRSNTGWEDVFLLRSLGSQGDAFIARPCLALPFATRLPLRCLDEDRLCLSRRPKMLHVVVLGVVVIDVVQRRFADVGPLRPSAGRQIGFEVIFGETFACLASFVGSSDLCEDAVAGFGVVDERVPDGSVDHGVVLGAWPAEQRLGRHLAGFLRDCVGGLMSSNVLSEARAVEDEEGAVKDLRPLFGFERFG